MSQRTTPATPRELTVRGVVLGGAITLLFTAANVYLGLKVGLTFATAIPAAVISMAVLRYFANHSVVENNIVQTIASAAGTLSAIIFVLPGLVIIGWWTGFPYWITVAACAIGGILGVMYSIPLRRALVTGSDLPYPEGRAAAEVLKVGDTASGVHDNRRGLLALALSSVAAAAFSLLSSMKLVSNSLGSAFRFGSGGTMYGVSLSLALIGVGHLVGLSVGIAMLVGLIISFFVLLPTRTWHSLPSGDISDQIDSVFSHEVRFIGAGAIAVAAVWTLLKIIGPIARGIVEAIYSSRARRQGNSLDLTERDIPFQYVAVVVVLSLIPIGLLLWDFVSGTALEGHTGGVIAMCIVVILLLGLLIASVCGYMAGLIGSSNSPISGVGILVVLIMAVLIKFTFGDASPSQVTALVAFTLFTTAVVFGIATISNDNLQDLKTGQLVGATPWKQQVALIIGVLFGAAVIPPILSLMQNAFGFAGAPGAGKDALAAPQASLISSLAQGVFGDSLDWGLIGLGAAIGVGVILVDEVLTYTTKLRLPPLAVGMGMYLPMSLTIIIPLGAILGRLYDRWAERAGGDVEHKKRLGVLVATGLIVGESLFGVVFAGIVAASGKDEPLALPFLDGGFLEHNLFGQYLNWAGGFGVIVFVLLVGGLYRWTQRAASQEAPTSDPVAKEL